jgi:flagellar biosynthesis protein FliR
MNIFMVGMPLKLMFGMWAMSITLPAAAQVIHDQFASMVRTLPLLYLPR